METKEDINKIGGCGASDVGKLFTGQGLKAKTAQTLAFEKAVEMITGKKKNISTIAMQHGIFSEEEAFLNVVKPFYPNAKYQSADSILIKESVWVTPDVVDDVEGLTIDIKCPYSVYTYFKNINKIPENYISQVQMQMIGTKHLKGAICVYLTSTNIDTYGNKIEYDIDINERHTYLPIQADKVYQDEILKRIDGLFEIRDLIGSDLQDSIEISDFELFNLCKTGKKVTRFKDKSNLLTWGGKIVNNNGTFYVVE